MTEQDDYRAELQEELKNLKLRNESNPSEYYERRIAELEKRLKGMP